MPLGDWLARIEEKLKENPVLYAVLLLLLVIIIFLAARKIGRPKADSGAKPRRIVEKHYYGEKPSSPSSAAAKAESSKAQESPTK